MEYGREGVIERLRQLDGDLLALYGSERRFEMVIVGGSALMVMSLAADARVTTDVDVLEVDSEVERLLARYDMNTDVATFLYRYPEGWRTRKVRVPFNGDVLDVYTLSAEDLAITKLLAWRATDREDLKAMMRQSSFSIARMRAILGDVTEVRINVDESDWERLMERFSELEGWARYEAS